LEAAQPIGTLWIKVVALKCAETRPHAERFKECKNGGGRVMLPMQPSLGFDEPFMHPKTRKVLRCPTSRWEVFTLNAEAKQMQRDCHRKRRHDSLENQESTTLHQTLAPG
jgi:hypothetical protein